MHGQELLQQKFFWYVLEIVGWEGWLSGRSHFCIFANKNIKTLLYLKHSIDRTFFYINISVQNIFEKNG